MNAYGSEGTDAFAIVVDDENVGIARRQPSHRVQVLQLGDVPSAEGRLHEGCIPEPEVISAIWSYGCSQKLVTLEHPQVRHILGR